MAFLRKICPPVFDQFSFIPSVGASGGMLVAWKGSLLQGNMVFHNEFAMSIDFSSKHNNSHWILTNIYAPCTFEGKRIFLEWFTNIDMPDDVNWMVVGDFNLIRSPENRNRPGGDVNEMFLINEAISALNLVEIPLHGKKFTWSNKQSPPLLERLDWFFISASWSSTFPNTLASSLVMETSDHCPCVISISTKIPKGGIFRFENYWLQHKDFLDIVQQSWSKPVQASDKAKAMSAKLKGLRRDLKIWRASLPNLSVAITNTKQVLSLMEFVEEFRDLTLEEWNFHKILNNHLVMLLEQQRIYWKQRGSIK